MAGSNVLTITDENFETEIAGSKGVAMVDFWATWCGPCMRLGAVVDELAADYRGKVKIGKLDTDTNPKVATKFSIMSIPTLLIFKDGKIYDKITGAVAKNLVVERLDKALTA